MIELPDAIASCEVSGTITAGVRVYCPDCSVWFAEWSSREKFPTIQAVLETCVDHRFGCPSEHPNGGHGVED